MPDRCGYSDDLGPTDLAMWRGQVASAIRGRRGQRFLRDLIAALDAMPEKRLIAGDLIRDGEVCALGAVGVRRRIKVEQLDSEDWDDMSRRFNIARQLVQDVEYRNDCDPCESPEQRWARVRKWASSRLRPDRPPSGA